MRQPAPDIDEKVPRTIFQLMMKLGMSLLTGAPNLFFCGRRVCAGWCWCYALMPGVGMEIEDSTKTSWGLSGSLSQED